ncbi:Holliday junction resolvase [Nitzschia inconspicua]|uniref:Holliday junction resolvase n=1 Tax=Nitzschia inconspicua TaxID=303405 RepID=A0A9K3L5H9_9STRA|nr:Holliday junction resolvase [Nitzschia inconspicua]
MGVTRNETKRHVNPQLHSLTEPTMISQRWTICLLHIFFFLTTASNALTLFHHRIQQSRCGPTEHHRVLTSTSVSSLGGDLSRAIEDAAANFVQESCPLLGVKSIGVDYGLVRTGIAVTVGYNPKPLDILVWEPSSTSEKQKDRLDDDGEDDSQPPLSRPVRNGNNRRNNDNGKEEQPIPGNTTQIAFQVVEIAKREQASQIIVGLPLHKNGTEAEQTNLTRVFAAELAMVVLQQLGPNIPVYLWDERYTSKEAAARAHSKDPTRFLYGTLDAEAACIILEHFYNDNGKGAELVVVQDQDMVQACIEQWEQRMKMEEERLLQEETMRNERLQRRKEAIRRDQMMMTMQQEENDHCTNKKKKKRKRKK